VGAQLVAKTWKEMRATMEDFDKVFDVVREQNQSKNYGKSLNRK